MTKDKKRLGRGLSSLISADFTKLEHEAPETAVQSRAADLPALATVPIDKVRRNPYQPRSAFPPESMSALVRSIQESGIIQPLVVRPIDDAWELIAGERRLRAAIQAGLHSVPVVVRQATDEQVLETALIENIHREDLNAIERATAYKKYADEFELPIEEVAHRVGEDRSTVANYLRLLELSDDIQRLVAERVITMGHARSLLGIADAQERWDLAVAVVENDLSVRALEEVVRRQKQGGKRQEHPASQEPDSRPLVRAIQDELTSALGMRVAIREHRKPNTGRVIIEYNSLDDFTRLTKALGLKGV